MESFAARNRASTDASSVSGWQKPRYQRWRTDRIGSWGGGVAYGAAITPAKSKSYGIGYSTYSCSTFCSYGDRAFRQWVTSFSLSWPANTVPCTRDSGKSSRSGGNAHSLSRKMPRVRTSTLSDTVSPPAPTYRSVARCSVRLAPRSPSSFLRSVVSVKIRGSGVANRGAGAGVAVADVWARPGAGVLG